MENAEDHGIEISWLFENARVKLEKIKANIDQQKKQVVRDLAKSLEGKIATDTICIEITNQLRGKVSDSFVRQCLDDKYKQSHRAENAKKQNKKQPIVEDKDDIEELATLTSLNQEPKKDRIILVESTGQALIHGDGECNADYERPHLEIQDIPREEDGVPPSQKLLSPKEHEPKLERKNDNRDIKECPGCQELYAKVIELTDALKKATQFVTVDKTTYLHEPCETVDVLQFEYRMVFDKLQRYLAALFPKIGSHGDVWLNGQIDKMTGKVISSDVGRLKPQQ